MAVTPWKTSDDMIEAVGRKISLPNNQNAFSTLDILSFCSEEMMISQVPSVLEYHQEYYVFPVRVPMLPNKTRYAIPDRAIAMKLRELFWEDQNGNLSEMSRIQSEDKAFFQRNTGTNQLFNKFYVEGNDIVLTPQSVPNPTGNLIFYIFIRPNQLVPNNRAATVANFSKTLTIDNSTISVGDILTITQAPDSGVVTYTTLTAVSGAPASGQFQIGASSIATATNLSLAITTTGIFSAVSTGTPSTNVISLTYNSLSTTMSSINSNNQPTLGIVVQSQQGVVFNSVPTTWLNPVTNITTPLFQNNILVDFLQTKPGHKIKAFDKLIPANGITGNTINFTQSDVPSELIIGDYICVSNECIIPFLPPDLHNGLAERAAARILASMGDQIGLAMSEQKIADIEKRQGNLLDNRVEGAPLKVTGRKSLLHFGKIARIRRY